MGTPKSRAGSRSERDPVEALKRRVGEAHSRAEMERQTQRLIEERENAEVDVSAELKATAASTGARGGTASGADPPTSSAR